MQIKFNIKLQKSCQKIGSQQKNRPQNGMMFWGLFSAYAYCLTHIVSVYNLHNS